MIGKQLQPTSRDLHAVRIERPSSQSRMLPWPVGRHRSRHLLGQSLTELTQTGMTDPDTWERAPERLAGAAKTSKKPGVRTPTLDLSGASWTGLGDCHIGGGRGWKARR